MPMVSYAVYDRDTGQVVHVHVEPAGLETSDEEILQLVDPRQGRALEVVRMPSGDVAAESLRVVDGQLSPAGREAGFGAAGSGDSSMEPVAERRYELKRPSADST